MDLAGYSRHLAQAQARFPALVDDALRASVPLAVSAVQARTPVRSGRLRASVSAWVSGQGLAVSLGAPYASEIEALRHMAAAGVASVEPEIARRVEVAVADLLQVP